MDAHRSAGLAPYSAAWSQALRRRLLPWYRRQARDLPWRRSGDPYAVWISEVMLQQTQVATVIPYFERFLHAFPSIAHLAAADEQAVLRLWEGLGYYRRARQLHKAANQIVQQQQGIFPRDFEVVRSLPGIGRYTAGAILSIAFDQPLPILEANTLRLHARLMGYDQNLRSTAAQNVLWQAAQQVLPARGAGTLNQALMELGATVCSPREPRCGQCPVSGLCVSFAQDLQQSIPRAVPQPVLEKVREAAVVVFRRQKILLVQRQEPERFAGLWDFPRFPIAAKRRLALHSELAETIQQKTGYRVLIDKKLVTLKHGVTRFRITLECYAARLAGGRAFRGGPAMRWFALAQLDDIPLSVTARRLAGILQSLRPPVSPGRAMKSKIANTSGASI